MEKVNTETKIYTSTELADVLHLSVEYICKELKEGRMIGYKKGGRWLVFHSDLVKWIKASE